MLMGTRQSGQARLHALLVNWLNPCPLMNPPTALRICRWSNPSRSWMTNTHDLVEGPRTAAGAPATRRARRSPGGGVRTRAPRATRRGRRVTSGRPCTPSGRSPSWALRQPRGGLVECSALNRSVSLLIVVASRSAAPALRGSGTKGRTQCGCSAAYPSSQQGAPPPSEGRRLRRTQAPLARELRQQALHTLELGCHGRELAPDCTRLVRRYVRPASGSRHADRLPHDSHEPKGSTPCVGTHRWRAALQLQARAPPLQMG